ncbi:MAG TPA: lysoplasmalogenase family protein, partial [Pyrinomonadaceae bacterium]|nr:lysoplasmalogenase family protein [Pyrinomonadaceae bacterium]
MNFGIPTIVFGFICLGFAGAYVFAEWRGSRHVSRTAKAVASTAFVLLAVVNGAADSTYGILILAALGFSWFGDLFLLSLRNEFLLAGIVAFLIAHVAYAAAFVSRGIDPIAFVIALILWNTAAFFMLYWLWKYLAGYFRIAVPVYLAAITLMTALAVATNSPIAVIAGIAF